MVQTIENDQRGHRYLNKLVEKEETEDLLVLVFQCNKVIQRN